MLRLYLFYKNSICYRVQIVFNTFILHYFHLDFCSLLQLLIDWLVGMKKIKCIKTLKLATVTICEMHEVQKIDCTLPVIYYTKIHTYCSSEYKINRSHRGISEWILYQRRPNHNKSSPVHQQTPAIYCSVRAKMATGCVNYRSGKLQLHSKPNSIVLCTAHLHWLVHRKCTTNALCSSTVLLCPSKVPIYQRLYCLQQGIVHKTCLHKTGKNQPSHSLSAFNNAPSPLRTSSTTEQNSH